MKKTDKLFNGLVRCALVVFQSGFEGEDNQITAAILEDQSAQPFLQNVLPCTIDRAVAEARKLHEAAEAKRIFFKELPREVFVQIDVETPKWGKADSDYYKKNPLVINGFQVPHRFVVEACEKVNRKRKEAEKKWRQDVDVFLLREIGKRYPDFIDIKGLTSSVFSFRGKNVEKERVKWTCLQIIEKRRQEKRKAWFESVKAPKRKTQSTRKESQTMGV